MGTALNQSFANASGDFATVIGALAGLNIAQGPVALDTISGQPYADFGTMNANNAALFMNALGQQMANARGSSASTGQRQALAQACEIEACDAVGPLSAWASALGGLGSVLGDSNASPSPTTSAARPPASTIASTRASSPASVSATPTAPSG